MRSRRVDVATRLLLTRSAMVVALIGVFSLGGVSANAADPSPSPSVGRSIAVSVPPDPVSLGPGQVGVVQLRVVNPGTTPVRVTVTGRGLTLGALYSLERYDFPAQGANPRLEQLAAVTLRLDVGLGRR